MWPRIVQMGYHRAGSYAPRGDERRLDLLVVPSDYVMAGAMLRGIAERAERPASHPATDGST
jgi:hypothetical protein